MLHHRGGDEDKAGSPPSRSPLETGPEIPGMAVENKAFRRVNESEARKPPRRERLCVKPEFPQQVGQRLPHRLVVINHGYQFPSCLHETSPRSRCDHGERDMRIGHSVREGDDTLVSVGDAVRTPPPPRRGWKTRTWPGTSLEAAQAAVWLSMMEGSPTIRSHAPVLVV